MVFNIWIDICIFIYLNWKIKIQNWHLLSPAEALSAVAFKESRSLTKYPILVNFVFYISDPSFSLHLTFCFLFYYNHSYPISLSFNYYKTKQKKIFIYLSLPTILKARDLISYSSFWEWSLSTKLIQIPSQLWIQCCKILNFCCLWTRVCIYFYVYWFPTHNEVC